MSAVEFYRQVTSDDGSAEGRNWDMIIPAADAAIAELEADRDEWMVEADLNLRTLIKSEEGRIKDQAALADFRSHHTGGGCGCGKGPGMP